MSTTTVSPVSSWRDKRLFLNLPWKLHSQDPYWVPPLRGNQKQLVGFSKHPFYDAAESQAFLARQGNQVVGRVLAIVNHAYNSIHNDEPCGFVGFFESIDDADVSKELFDAAYQWLVNKGQHVMRGPVNPSLNYECGLLIDGFHMPPTFMITYNPAYYPALWESYGFKKAQDLMSFTGFAEHLENLEKKIQFIASEAKDRFQMSLRTIRLRHFSRDVQTFLRIYNASLESQWGHVPMSEAEMKHAANSLRFLIVPALTIIAEIDGKPVGSMLGLLDYNPRIKKSNGRLFPFGAIRLVLNRHKIKRIRLVSTNVLPEYQRWGVGVVLAANLLQPALDYGVNQAEFSWVLESNHLSRKTLERGKMSVEKMHRIYDYCSDEFAQHRAPDETGNA